MDKITGWLRERVVLLLAAPVLSSIGSFLNSLVLAAADGNITDAELHQLVQKVGSANKLEAVVNVACLLVVIYLLKKDKQ